MSLRQPLTRDRLLLVGGLYLSAAAAGVVAWAHAASTGGIAFFCGGAEAHCWACYAAPLLAAMGLAAAAAPLPKAAPLQARPL